MAILKKTKKRIEKIHPSIKRLVYEIEDLRFATPKIVADWRAERLKCNTIADIGCGIGFQSFAFAERCKNVYSIEIDKRKIEYAKRNAKILGIKNIEFIHGDVLEEKIAEKIKDADVVFCDTERLPSETKRKIDSIKPDVKRLLELYSRITDKIAIEFPPQIREIPFDCEKEYIYFNENIRLTLYFGKLKTCERSAVILPGGHILKSSSRQLEVFNIEGGIPNKYLYEVNDAIVAASLIKELAQMMNNVMLFYKNRFCLFSSDEFVKNPFIKNSFNVLAVCKNKFDEIVKNLIELDVGKVVLRASIIPEKYWEERRKYEKELSGERTVHLFLLDKAIICEKIK